MIELSEPGRDWARARRDINLMAEVVCDPAPWPEGFVRLATRYANHAGATHAAKRLFDAAVEVDPYRTYDALRQAVS